MKKIFSTLVVLVFFVTVKSQILSEWTQQRKTQIKYLVTQIASLRIYVNHVQKGYKILNDGLEAIGTIKRGDFNLHDGFFAAMTKVNPVILNNPMVSKIVMHRLKALQLYHDNSRRIRSSDQFSDTELTSIDRTYEKLLAASRDLVLDLDDLLSSGHLTMTDDERLKRLGKLGRLSQETYDMFRQFGQDNLILAVNRSREIRDIGVMRENYNLVKP